MPTKTVNELIKTIEKMQEQIVEMRTDSVWIKRIIIGAASLGFLEKLVGWMVGK